MSWLATVMCANLKWGLNFIEKNEIKWKYYHMRSGFVLSSFRIECEGQKCFTILVSCSCRFPRIQCLTLLLYPFIRSKLSPNISSLFVFSFSLLYYFQFIKYFLKSEETPITRYSCFSIQKSTLKFCIFLPLFIYFWHLHYRIFLPVAKFILFE